MPGIGLSAPLVIAHRGASAHRPEHTLEAYRLGIEAGADFIEPDLVSTRDGELVARHENEISTTTDVADHPEFRDRRTTKTIDGQPLTGWFTENFTLAELKTLRARERIPRLRPASAQFNDRYAIPTLQEIIDLARQESTRRGLVVGLYPETKHPSYFDGIGLSLEEPLVETLHRNGYEGPNAPVFLQSFAAGNLRELHGMTELPLIQLLEHGPVAPSDLARIAEYAQGIGPHKDLIVPRDTAGNLLEPTGLLRDAHATGLQVHAWTFRPENYFLPQDFRIGDLANASYSGQHGDAAAEYRFFYSLGLDGVFSDDPREAVRARSAS